MEKQRSSSNRTSLRRAIFISLLAHLLLFSPIFFFLFHHAPEEATGTPSEGGYVYINVNLVPAHSPAPLPSTPSLQERNGQTTERENIGGNSNVANIGNNGTSDILAEIQKKIERHKQYPLIAYRQGVEGMPIISFQIENNGQLKDLKLIASSGNKLLDNAALQAATQAAPFPFYPNLIEIKVTYRIR